MGLIGGVFYDRENSLLASLIVSDRINEKVKLNIYPGVIHLGPVSPGLFVSLGKGDQLIAGIDDALLTRSVSPTEAVRSSATAHTSFSHTTQDATRMVSLKNKVVCITGASSGIGAACAAAFAQTGLPGCFSRRAAPIG